LVELLLEDGTASESLANTTWVPADRDSWAVTTLASSESMLDSSLASWAALFVAGLLAVSSGRSTRTTPGSPSAEQYGAGEPYRQ
jgi:hypothetical protein